MIIQLIAIISGAAVVQSNSLPAKMVRVAMSPTVILPQQEVSADVVMAKPEEQMWAAVIGIEEIAKIKVSVQIEAGGLAMVMGPNTILWRADPVSGMLDGQALKGKMYCGVSFRKGVPDSGGTLDLIFRTSNQARSEPRLCLLDENDDGLFDHTLAVGRLKSTSKKLNITLTPYETIRDFQVPGLSVRFRPIMGGSLQGPQISLSAFTGNDRLVAAAIHMRPRNGGNFIRVFSERSIKKSTYPADLKFGDINVTVNAYDPSTRTVTARLDRGFYRTPIYFEAASQFTFIVY